MQYIPNGPSEPKTISNNLLPPSQYSRRQTQRQIKVQAHLHHTQECCKGDPRMSTEKAKIRPLAMLTIFTKIAMGNYVVDVTRHAKFCRTPFRGFFSPYTWFSVPSGWL